MFDAQKSIMNLELFKHFMMFHCKYGTIEIVNNQSNVLIKYHLSFILVTESFRDFCKKEILTGENLYDAGSVHGLQVC